MASPVLLPIAAIATLASPPAPADVREMMRRYRDMTSVRRNGPDACPEATAGIVVRGRATRPAPRLPLPEERWAEGEAVRHPSEPPRAAAVLAAPPRERSRLGDTVRKGIGAIRSAITGEDPGY